METEQRVAKFGSRSLRELYANMFSEDFREEFELIECDDSMAYLSWDLIIKCTPTGEDAIQTYATLGELAEKTKGNALFVGYDVARRKDQSEISVLEERDGKRWERYTRRMENTKYEEQMEFLRALLSLPNVMRMRGDRTGLGDPVMEKLEDEFPGIAGGVHFTGGATGSKAIMASRLRRAMLADQIRFEANPAKNYQMHSVKKQFTASETMVLVVSREGEDKDAGHHHADVFWARALAEYAVCDDEYGEPSLSWGND